MCLNCGCDMPNDNMGNVNNLTWDMVKRANEVNGMEITDTVNSIKKTMDLALKTDAAKVNENPDDKQSQI